MSCKICPVLGDCVNIDDFYKQDLTWYDLLLSLAKSEGIGTKGKTYPIFGYRTTMEEPAPIGWCRKNERGVVFLDADLPEPLLKYIKTLNEFVDVGFWKSKVECLLYHGVAVVADERIESCAREFGWYEAYMAAHRGQYDAHQDWAREPEYEP